MRLSWQFLHFQRHKAIIVTESKVTGAITEVAWMHHFSIDRIDVHLVIHYSLSPIEIFILKLHYVSLCIFLDFKPIRPKTSLDSIWVLVSIWDRYAGYWRIELNFLRWKRKARGSVDLQLLLLGSDAPEHGTRFLLLLWECGRVSAGRIHHLIWLEHAQSVEKPRSRGGIWVGKVSHCDMLHAIAALQAYVATVMLIVVVYAVCVWAADVSCTVQVKVPFAVEKKSEEHERVSSA